METPDLIAALCRRQKVYPRIGVVLNFWKRLQSCRKLLIVSRPYAAEFLQCFNLVCRKKFVTYFEIFNTLLTLWVELSQEHFSIHEKKISCLSGRLVVISYYNVRESLSGPMCIWCFFSCVLLAFKFVTWSH